MPAYAIAVIRETRYNDDIVEYLRRIDDTLAPFSGRYLIHGGPYHLLEGTVPGDLVMIEFPTMEDARAWYESAAYAAIRSLRMNSTDGDVLLVDGVPSGHKAADILSRAS